MSSERPEVGSGKVPVWIKVMWVLGITWIVCYIYWGLQTTPIEW